MSQAQLWPPDEAVVQAVHDRYQREIVEGLGLCPFARRSRELRQVHRPVFFARDPAHCPEPGEVAAALAQLVAAKLDAEIVLLTFPIPARHPWWDPARFELFLGELREAWAQTPPPRAFYLVSFHPDYQAPRDRALTPDSLVGLLRRSPDPVVQCVDAAVLDRVRKQAQASSRERMLRELELRDPALAELFARSIAPDPELSSDIAQQNFEAVGEGEGLARLSRKIAALQAERDRAYGCGHGEVEGQR